MLLSAVILILQETLEAALLVSVLSALCYLQRMKLTWLAGGLVSGLVFATVYAMNLQTISGWFDYVGQELVNAALQGSIGLLLVAFFWRWRQQPGENRTVGATAPAPGFEGPMWIAAAIVMLAITREGSEIVLYLSGLIQQGDHLQATLIGSGLGFGIGLSIGFLMFYLLLGMSHTWGLRLAIFLLALLAGNMLAQAVMQLTQADWIPSTQALWDSSAWLPEQTVTGQLLYALVGYEATPTAYFLLAYSVGFIGVLVAAVCKVSNLLLPLRPAGPAEAAG